MPIQKSLEIWAAQTLCDIGIILSILSLLLFISRPYFERILENITLRVAADIWWIFYILIRDGSLLFAFLIGLFTLNLDLMADIKIGLPFVPIGTVFMAAALVSKIFYNTEIINKYYIRTTTLITIAAILNTLGFVFIMEAPGSEYTLSDNSFWLVLKSLRSNSNPELSLLTFYICICLLTLLAVIIIFRSFRLLQMTIKKNE